jgi:tetratricopeptide (TPR) repeat protein
VAVTGDTGPGVASRDRTPAGLARTLIETGSLPSERLLDSDLRAIGWALKDEWYLAWSTEPQRAVQAAQALRRLHDDQRTIADPLLHREVGALADWAGGIAQVTAGRLSEAVLAFDTAASAFRSIDQPGHAAQTQVAKIMALSMLGRYDEAIECAEHTQREFVAVGDVHSAGKVSLNLGAVHETRGNYAEAARHARDAAIRFARVGDHQHSVMADIMLANALTSLGDFDEALRIYARARMRASARSLPVLQALVEEAVALVCLARGQFGEALAGLEGARRRYETLAMPLQLAVAEKQLADTYLELRLLPEALALFEQSLARFRALDMPDNEAWTLAQRGRVQVLMGQSAPAAESFESAEALFAAHELRVGESAVALARAELALDGGDAGAALVLAARAGRGFAAAGLADGCSRADIVRAHALLRAGSVEQASALFDSTLARARELGLLTARVRCLTGQGLVAQALGNVEAARTAFDAAVSLFEEQRRALPDDAMRSAFLSDHLRPYQELLRLAILAHAERPHADQAADVLRRLDRFRAVALGERAGQGGEGADTEATQPLRERLNWLYRAVQRMQEDGDSAAVQIDELRRTEHALLEQSRRELLAAPPRSAALGDGDGELDLTELRRQLGNDGVLVEYGVQDDELFACIVDHHGVALHRRIARWSEVLEALRSARFQIETLRHGAAPVVQHLSHLTERARARLRKLHALVWQPLAPALASFRRVLIVPHAQLGAVPFAALGDGECCLCERHELAIAPSAKLALRGLVRTPSSATRALVLGESTRLPHAAQEARLVADLFGGQEAFIGKHATIEALRDHAGDADVVHLACHAQFRSDNPRFSALHLHDGVLTVDLVERLSLAPATVVLSGCETGLSDVGSGDDMVGLVRAFLIAGASRVLASLWPVDDAVTAGFMAHFYTALRSGHTPAAALGEAQRVVRIEHPHPLYWAAFTLYGGW